MQCSKRIIEITEACVQVKKSPLLWAIDVCTCLHEMEQGSIPSIELAEVLVSQGLALDGSTEILAYLNYSIKAHLLHPLHALALLTTKVIPVRHQKIRMYSAYLGLASAYVFSLNPIKEVTNCDRLLKAVVEALQAPYSIGKFTDFGTNLVHFLLCLLYGLAHAIVEDWSLSSSESERRPKCLNFGSHGFGCQMARAPSMNVEDGMNTLRQGELESTLKALDVIGKIFQNRKTSALLRLAQRNLPKQWSMVLEKLQVLVLLRQDSLSNIPSEVHDSVKNFSYFIQDGLQQSWKTTNMPIIKVLSGSDSLTHTFLGTGMGAAWLPFDIFMEDAMEGRRILATSMAKALAELMMSLQAFYCATWHDLFLGLWTAALRLVSRERDFIEGPKPHVESRLCLLLSIVPLACRIVIEEEEKYQQSPYGGNISLEYNTRFDKIKEKKTLYSRRTALKYSLQVLAQFNYLLIPPAVEAATSMIHSRKGAHDPQISNDVAAIKAVGDMRQLILDACIARGLVETSAYSWPGYFGTIGNIGHALPTQASPWLEFMEGAPLSGTLRHALASTPAGSLAELEKAYQMAVSGTDEDRPAAASLLCGASLLCAWNVQEHAVRLAVQLLSPCDVSKHWGEHCLLPHTPMLLSALGALSSVDALNVLNLHGKFAELATSLLPICEYFGSLSATGPFAAKSMDTSYNMLFSYALLLLLRIWDFHKAPLGCESMPMAFPLGSMLNLELLLELSNFEILSRSPLTALNKLCTEGCTDEMGDKKVDGSRAMDPDLSSSSKNVDICSLDSYPNFKAWYLQYHACNIPSQFSSIRIDTVETLLAMMFRKINLSRTHSAPTGCSSNSSSSSTEDDTVCRPLLAPWDILSAVPLVVEKVLTACAHGRLSSRDLTTGLSDLLDYFPGSIAPIISYIKAEVTRGCWKSVSMNGIDWPSPAANLIIIEEEMKSILTSAGVTFPNRFEGVLGGDAPTILPLPLAAFVSLTITLKVDKQSSLEAIMGLAGPALALCASANTWPCMPIVAALWAQKMRKWHDFIVFSATRTIFQQDKDTVKQLLRSCFAVTVGSTSLLPRVNANGSVGALFGSKNFSSGSQIPVAPGILYLRIYPSLHDIMFILNEVLSLVIGAAREQGSKACVHNQSTKADGTYLKYPGDSFAHCTARALQASILGASLLFVSGGPMLVQTLFKESLPTLFLSGDCLQSPQPSCRRDTVLEGYVVAHFSALSAILAWGVSLSGLQSTTVLDTACTSPSDNRQTVLGFHMDFLASVLEGRISIGCGPILWRSYVVTFLAFIVTCAPKWFKDVKHETLKVVAKGLRFWNEHALAIALLERGGPAAMGSAAEIIIS